MTPAESILIGDSAAIRRLRRTIERVAPARLPVLIEGATGTGKELVAGLLHQLAGRRGAFVAFNVCSLAETMFEDALFGHVRGAYTGAASDTPGFLREAHGGSVFFDEIGGLPAQLQAKLLRAIETGVFRPIGGSRDTTSDFRLIAATNEGLDGLIAAKRFRADLAHRMSGIVLTMPAIAERVEDVPMLVSHFARGMFVEPEVIAQLQERCWPGNVRELKQVVEAAMVFARDSLDVDALRHALSYRSRPTGAAVAEPEAEPDAEPDAYVMAQRTRLVELLEQTSWDTERAASDLGVHRSTLYRRLKRLGIAIPPSICVRERQESTEANGYPFALIRANPRESPGGRLAADR